MFTQSYQQPDLGERWIQHMRRSIKPRQVWACIHCQDRKILLSANDLWDHARRTHQDMIPADPLEIEIFRTKTLEMSALKRPTKDDSSLRKSSDNEASGSRQEPPKRAHSKLPIRYIAESLNHATHKDEDIIMQDSLKKDSTEAPRKRAAVSDGISAGSVSPFLKSESSLPRRSKARPTSVPYGSTSDIEQARERDNFEIQRPSGSQKRLWPPYEPVARSPFHDYTINLEPETRPISQEQLVAEVKGIYASLVMVEAKCIEFDQKATLAQADEAQLNIASLQTKKLRDFRHLTRREILADITRTTSRLEAKPRIRRPSNRRKALRIKIKDTDHLACPDSGSEENIMSEDFATTHDLRIRRRPQDKQRFELGNGKHVWSIGRVRVPVELRHSLTRKKRWFYILLSCPVPLILGMPFLKETEILSKNRHLLEECPAEMSNISSLLWIGTPRQQLSCSLDGHELTAHADTGSDLNLISLKCAKREGFAIDRRREARRRIKVGDGSESETIGQVLVYNLSLDWRKSETPILDMDFDTGSYQTSDSQERDLEVSDSESKQCGVIFHVLPNLPCDIIFGRSLLEQTDAFNLCPSLSSSSPFHLQDGNNPRAFHVLISLGPLSLRIPLSRRKRRTAEVQVNGKDKHDDERHGEMFRRSRREDEISALPVPERGIAAVREARKAREWDDLHTNCIYCGQV